MVTTFKHNQSYTCNCHTLQMSEHNIQLKNNTRSGSKLWCVNTSNFLKPFQWRFKNKYTDQGDYFCVPLNWLNSPIVINSLLDYSRKKGQHISKLLFFLSTSIVTLENNICRILWERRLYLFWFLDMYLHRYTDKKEPAQWEIYI